MMSSRASGPWGAVWLYPEYLKSDRAIGAAARTSSQEAQIHYEYWDSTYHDHPRIQM
jgi:hypothetical protein